MVYLWLRAFALTVVIESAIAVPLLREADARLWRRIALVFFANLASHPAVWFVFPAFGWRYGATLWVSEAWAAAIEAAFYFTVFPGASKARLCGVALMANGASWAVGIMLQGMTRWFG
jgi:hypothetical protein